MEKLKLVLLLLGCSAIKVLSQTLPCRTANGNNCTSSSICPNTVVNYTCTITNGTAAGATDWILPNGTCPTNPFPDKIRLVQYVSQQCSALGSGGTPNICGPYRASSIQSSDPTYCLSSILTVNITSTMNGSTVTCSNTNFINPAITTAVSSATISIVANPGKPKFTVETTGLYMLSVVMNSPNSSGTLPTSFNVTITNGSYINTTLVPADSNGSSMVIFTGLTNGSYYNVSVVAINCAGSSNATTQQVLWVSPNPTPPTSSTIPTTSPASTSTATSSPSPSTYIPTIIGGVLGGLAVIIIVIVIVVVVVVVFCVKNKGETAGADQKDGSEGVQLTSYRGDGANKQPSQPQDGPPKEPYSPKPEDFEALYAPTKTDPVYSAVDTSKKANAVMYADVTVGRPPQTRGQPASTEGQVFYAVAH